MTTSRPPSWRRSYRKNEFTLEDYLEQMGQMQKMGGLGKMLEMMPGLGSQQGQRRRDRKGRKRAEADGSHNLFHDSCRKTQTLTILKRQQAKKNRRRDQDSPSAR